MTSPEEGDVTVGVDIGGTSIKAAVIDRDGHIVETRTAATPHTAQETDDALVTVIEDLAGRHPVSAVGLAVAAFITADQQTVMFAPHLAWRDSAVPARLTKRLGVPVVMEHDVNAAALAEYRIGASAGVPVSILVALGTGIGAGLMVDGALYRGGHGVAPELGHVTVVVGGRPCPCGKSGCWERYCSGTALAQTARELGMSGHPSGAEVGAAALAGDRLALTAVEDLSSWLAVGLALVTDVFDPEVVVIGGGVSRIAHLFIPGAVSRMTTLVTGADHRPLPKVVPALLGEAASMVGAALIARDARPTR